MTVAIGEAQRAPDQRQLTEQFTVKLTDLMHRLDIVPKGHVRVWVWPNGDGITISRQITTDGFAPHDG